MEQSEPRLGQHAPGPYAAVRHPDHARLPLLDVLPGFRIRDLRGLVLAVVIALCLSLAGGQASTASGQLVVRRLSQPATSTAHAKSPRANDDGHRHEAVGRATPPPRLEPAGRGAGPE